MPLSHCKTFVVVYLMFSVFCGCNSNQQPTNKKPTMTFTVNPSLLGDTILLQECGLSLRLPKNWQKISDSVQKILETRLETTQDYGNGNTLPRLRINGVYSLTNNEASFIISYIAYPKKDSTDSLIINRFKSQLQAQSKNAEIGIADFIANGIPVTQAVIRTQENTIFKLIFKAKTKIVQCDYIISTKIFQREIRAVESSIGSMQIQ